MPEEMQERHRVARPTTPTLIVVAVVAVVFFMSGYLTSTLLNERRVTEQSMERFWEFISIGTDLGILAIDTQKLDEIACIASESEWEDKDAAERHQEPTPQPPSGRTGRQ